MDIRLFWGVTIEAALVGRALPASEWPEAPKWEEALIDLGSVTVIPFVSLALTGGGKLAASMSPCGQAPR